MYIDVPYMMVILGWRWRNSPNCLCDNDEVLMSSDVHVKATKSRCSFVVFVIHVYCYLW